MEFQFFPSKPTTTDSFVFIQIPDFKLVSGSDISTIKETQRMKPCRNYIGASYPRHLRSNMVHQISSCFPNSHQKLHYETRHSLLCKCEQLINHSIFPVTGKHDDNHLEEPTGPRTTGNLEIPSLQASALQALPQNTS